METFAPLISAIVNNALLHSNSRIKQMPPQIIHILRFYGRFAASYFVMKCVEARAVRWPEVWKFYRSLRHYCTFGLEAANDAQNVRIHTAREKETTSRIYQK